MKREPTYAYEREVDPFLETTDGEPMYIYPVSKDGEGVAVLTETSDEVAESIVRALNREVNVSGVIGSDDERCPRCSGNVDMHSRHPGDDSLLICSFGGEHVFIEVEENG